MGLSNFNTHTVPRLRECMSEKGRIQTSRPCWEWIALTIVEQFGTVNQHGELSLIHISEPTRLQ